MTEPPRCRGCKRRLKQPSPSGYGPVCERRVNGTPAQRPRASSPAADVCDGQTEIPLEPLQVTLWSL